MIIKWVEWDFFCDICHAEVVHPDNEHVKSEAIKDLRNEIYEPENSLKGWIIKGNSVTCNKCKKEEPKPK
jgi:hypothetical protein